MLSDEDKARIEAEERYRASLREGEKPVQVTSFTDKVNKAGCIFGIFVILATVLAIWAIVANKPVRKF